MLTIEGAEYLTARAETELNELLNHENDPLVLGFSAGYRTAYQCIRKQLQEYLTDELIRMILGPEGAEDEEAQ